jgi:hypothetical protein
MLIAWTRKMALSGVDPKEKKKQAAEKSNCQTAL